MSDKTSDKTSDKRLLSCPFCGGKAKICGYYFIQCTKCGTSTLTHTNREEAIKTWNTRKPMQEIVERLEKEKVRKMFVAGRSNGKTLQTGINYGIATAISIVKEVGGMND